MLFCQWYLCRKYNKCSSAMNKVNIISLIDYALTTQLHECKTKLDDLENTIVAFYNVCMEINDGKQ